MAERSDWQIAPHLSEAEIAEIRALFDRYDRDRNGRIDVREIRAAWKQWGMDGTDEEIAELIKQYDVNENGVIDWWEFLQVTARKSGRHVPADGESDSRKRRQ